MLVFRPSILAHISLALVFFTGLSLGVSAESASLQQFAVVKVEKLNVRAAPDPGAPVLRVLEKDARVRVLMEQNDWLQVVVGQKLGYIHGHGRYVERYTRHQVSEEKDQNLALALARAREIENQIREKQKEIGHVSKKKNVLMSDLEALDREAAEHREQLQEMMAAAEKTAARICRLETEAGELRSKLARRKGHADRRIVALYKLCRLGRMNLLATADSAHELFLRKAGIERVVAHDETVLQRIQSQRQRLEKVLARLRQEHEARREQALEYEQMLTRLAQKRTRRRQMLAALENRKTDRQETLDYLRDAARRLEDTISALKAADSMDSADFASYQGLLKMPVQGKIVSRFGKTVTPDSGIVNYCRGIEVRSPRGAPVRAVFGGDVAYADWLRGYGRVVILSHGGSYHTVYAHIADLFCSRGDTVETGEVIATVGDSGSAGGPALYFEIRHHSDPVDPLKWIDPSIQTTDKGVINE